MNVNPGLDYIKAGLLKAGLRAGQIQASMDLARPGNHDSVPSASVYALLSRFRRQSRKVRIDAGELKPPVEGAVAGMRHTLMGGLNWFEITLQQKSTREMENTLSKFLEYLGDTPLVDAAGNIYAVLGDGNEKDRELEIVWNDHDAQDRVTCTFQLPLPGIVWRDHPLLPVEIVVEYRREGGNPDE